MKRNKKLRNCRGKVKPFYFPIFHIFFLLFEQKASHFNFTVGPENYLASPAYPPRIMSTPLPHPPNSPDRVLSNFFFLFPWMKRFSKGNILPKWKR